MNPLGRTVYYNENDRFAAEWLRRLITAKQMPEGDVDDRSIVDVRPGDLYGYSQCHFFAGIGGWPLALDLAGWPADRIVWTGSCPCQPFSAAGKRNGAADERHLWPHWFHLIRECMPAVIFGEQVEAAIGWGWLDAVCADLEGQGYACGAAVLPACGVGAPHIRQRLWFVGDAQYPLSPRRELQQLDATVGGWPADRSHASSSPIHDLADANPPGRGEQRRGGLLDGEWPPQRHDADGCGALCELGDPARDGEWQSRLPEAGERRPGETGRPSAWSDCDWLSCTDGKARPVESGTFPLAHGVPNRTSKLRAYGNAIVPQIAAEFIKAYRGVSERLP
jgi:DNA (cytosine-5)-methyltransferase 1